MTCPRWRAARLRLCAIAFFAVLAPQLRASVTVVSAAGETAAIDGRAWDATFPGERTMDAVHRAVLVRFPTLAHVLASFARTRVRVVKAQLVLDYDGYELAPTGYLVRNALGEAKWRQDPPRWHVIGWALRRPWTSDARFGPTFNAYINGAGYWTRYGAGDLERDRYAQRYGPAELSSAQPRAAIDLLPLFAHLPVSEGVRILRDNGVLLKKWETYDQRYRDGGDAYEWAVPVGGHGLKFRNPHLTLALERSPAQDSPATRLELEAPVDVRQLREALIKTATGGPPTAVMPDATAFTRRAESLSLPKARDMTAWERTRVAELLRLGGGRASAWAHDVEARDYDRYRQLVREVLATPPRYWQGWGIHEDLLIWYRYRDLLPGFVQDHVKAYWEAWLMPQVPTREFVHPQSAAALEYYQRTHDWRGRASFFRDGYNYALSTQNFNQTAAMGALLGGGIIGSPRAIADGRHGLETFPLRTWGMAEGTMQEMLDHYYLSISLSGQKLIADFAPTAFDRLIGRILVDRTIELLAAAYHPRLRRIVNPSGRARMSGVFVEQDGIYGVLHTLSRNGVLNYLDRKLDDRIDGMSLFGPDFPPGRVAVQTATSAWAPQWVSHIVDDKPLPFEETAADTVRGAFLPPLWRRTYLGHHYGLSSQDMHGGVVDLLAQWSHGVGTATGIDSLGTLTARYIVNETDLAATSAGEIEDGGSMVTFQHRNRAIVCTKPHSDRARIAGIAGKAGVQSLATIIALWDFRPKPQWDVRIDDRKITSFPARLKAGQVVTLRDGVSYLGIVPLPATDLGRADEIVIDIARAPSEGASTAVKPAMTLTSYNLQRASDGAGEALDWDRITRRTFNGFVLELGDAAEYRDFDAFSLHMQSNTVRARWSEREKVMHVAYRSGDDLMEIGCGTDYEKPAAHYPVVPAQRDRAIVYRRVNGRWPYLPAKIDRDTSLAQSGTSGRLQKNGAVLVTAENRKAILQTEPLSATFAAYNPLPDLVPWKLSLPGGVTIEADGKVSLLRLIVQPRRRTIAIDYAARENQHGPEMARHLIVRGMKTAPSVTVNGAPVDIPSKPILLRGRSAYTIPLPVPQGSALSSPR